MDLGSLVFAYKIRKIIKYENYAFQWRELSFSKLPNKLNDPERRATL